MRRQKRQKTESPSKGVGGWGEIRTHGTLAGPAVFKTAALNHSATHPLSTPITRVAAACNFRNTGRRLIAAKSLDQDQGAAQAMPHADASEGTTMTIQLD